MKTQEHQNSSNDQDVIIITNKLCKMSRTDIQKVYDESIGNDNLFHTNTGILKYEFDSIIKSFKIPRLKKLNPQEQLFAVLYFQKFYPNELLDEKFVEIGRMIGYSNAERDGKNFMKLGLEQLATARSKIVTTSIAQNQIKSSNDNASKEKVKFSEDVETISQKSSVDEHATPQQKYTTNYFSSDPKTPSTHTHPFSDLSNNTTSTKPRSRYPKAKEELTEVKPHTTPHRSSPEERETSPIYENRRNSTDIRCNLDGITRGLLFSQVQVIPSALANSKLGKNKYGLDGWFYYRQVDEVAGKKALLVWDNSTTSLRSSEEFMKLLSQRHPGEIATCAGSKGLPQYTTLTFNEVRVLVPDSCLKFLNEKCTKFQVDGLYPIFHPSKGRPNDIPKIPYEGFAQPDCARLRIIVVEPAEVDQYAEVHLQEDHNTILLVLPSDGLGIGSTRAVIQRFAVAAGWQWVWMVDDSACKFYYYTANGQHLRSGSTVTSYQHKDCDVLTFVSGVETRLEQHLIEDPARRNKIAAVGTTKFRGGSGVQEEYGTGQYPSSAFLINVRLTTEHAVFFNAEHICAEDICFYTLCVASGLECYVDKMFTHSKANAKTGGAQYAAQTGAIVANIAAEKVKQEEEKQEQDAADLMEADVRLELHISLPSAFSTDTSVTPLSSRSHPETPWHHAMVTQTNGGVSICAVEAYNETKPPTRVNAALQHIALSCSNMQQSEGCLGQSAFVYCTAAAGLIWRVQPAERDYAAHQVTSCADICVVSVAETTPNTLWVASNASNHRVDYRSPIVTATYSYKTDAGITQIAALDEHRMLLLKRNGGLLWFDDRYYVKLGKNAFSTSTKYAAHKSSMERVLSMNSNSIQRRPKLYSLDGHCLLTYNSDDNRRWGLVFSPNQDCKLDDTGNERISFHGPAEPSFQVVNNRAVVSELHYSAAKGQQILRTWTPAVSNICTTTLLAASGRGTTSAHQYVPSVFSACKGMRCVVDSADVDNVRNLYLANINGI